MKYILFTIRIVIVILFAFNFTNTLPAVSNEVPVDLKPEEILKNAARKWDRIMDYQALIHQSEVRPNGKHPNSKKMERWALVTLIKEDKTAEHSKPRPEIQKGRDTLSLFRLDFFDKKVSWDSVSNGVVQNATPETIYFSDSMEKLYTYKPKQNSLTIDPLDENVPIEEFLYLAGFAEFNIEQFFEEVYLDEKVITEVLDRQPAYRLTIYVKKPVQEVVPPRFVWLDQDSLFPLRFSVESDVAIHFEFIDWKIDQDLNYTKLIPEVPQDVFVVDHTSGHARK